MILNILKGLWDKFDGKKTVTGLIVLAMTFVETKYPGALLMVAEWLKLALQDGGVVAGGALTGLGLVHKGVKKSGNS